VGQGSDGWLILDRSICVVFIGDYRGLSVIVIGVFVRENQIFGRSFAFFIYGHKIALLALIGVPSRVFSAKQKYTNTA
jgi:hypothetical protein